MNPDVRPNLSDADLRGVKLGKANLIGADLRWANLCNVDLSGANLSKANLSDVNLIGANLSEANLSETDLSGTDLIGANLSKANLSEAYLRLARLNMANFVGANLRRADLSEASLVEANLKGTDITGCNVYGVSAWNVELDKETIQKDLIITNEREPIVMVDDLEVAQFVHLLLHHNRLRNVLNAVTEKGVLILGRFGGGGVEVLRAIADRLRDLGYTPIIFDFERPRGHSYTETIMTLVGMVRFVIADLSGPSVPQELYATVPHYKRPFVPILETGHKQYSLFIDLLENPNVFEPVEFESLEQLLTLLPEQIVAPAEAYVEKRQEWLMAKYGLDNN